MGGGGAAEAGPRAGLPQYLIGRDGYIAEVFRRALTFGYAGETALARAWRIHDARN